MNERSIELSELPSPVKWFFIVIAGIMVAALYAWLVWNLCELAWTVLPAVATMLR